MRSEGKKIGEDRGRGEKGKRGRREDRGGGGQEYG